MKNIICKIFSLFCLLYFPLNFAMIGMFQHVLWLHYFRSYHCKRIKKKLIVLCFPSPIQKGEKQENRRSLHQFSMSCSLPSPVIKIKKIYIYSLRHALSQLAKLCWKNRQNEKNCPQISRIDALATIGWRIIFLLGHKLIKKNQNKK